MCQYSTSDGKATEWHLVHLGSRAIGGAGLVIVEATAVEARGRISAMDAGLWEDSQIDSWRRVADFVAAHGAVPAVQLAHAGWKASTNPPFTGGGRTPTDKGGWTPISVGAQPFNPEDPSPIMLTRAMIDEVKANFRLAIHRAIAAHFQIIEIHAAHGYLLHSFYSPVSNTRTDQYGGSFENRTGLLIEVIRDARSIMPASMPLLVRLSCSDWREDGWSILDSVRLSGMLKDEGVDLVDCSSGGQRNAKIAVGPHYQVPFAEQIRNEAKIPTAAVGMITDPVEADKVISSGQADLVLLAREFLRDAYWPINAAKALKVFDQKMVPEQYARAFT